MKVFICIECRRVLGCEDNPQGCSNCKRMCVAHPYAVCIDVVCNSCLKVLKEGRKEEKHLFSFMKRLYSKIIDRKK